MGIVSYFEVPWKEITGEPSDKDYFLLYAWFDF